MQVAGTRILFVLAYAYLIKLSKDQKTQGVYMRSYGETNLNLFRIFYVYLLHCIMFGDKILYTVATPRQHEVRHSLSL